MGLQIDWYNQIIQVTSPTTDLSAQVLHDFIEDEMATPRGSSEHDIINPEGKIEDPTNPGIYSQIILVINSPWQIQFWAGSGYTRIYGGKLVGGLNDQPLKATGTAGDISVLESPVDGVTVVSGSGVTAQDKTDIIGGVWTDTTATMLATRIMELWMLKGCNPANPATFTRTSITVGGITMTISGDGELTSTVTRQS